LPKASVNPTLDQCNKIIARLEKQKRLLADPTYMRTVRSWSKNETGEKSIVEKKQCALPVADYSADQLFSSSKTASEV
jgi:hypothetical protein